MKRVAFVTGYVKTVNPVSAYGRSLTLWLLTAITPELKIAQVGFDNEKDRDRVIETAGISLRDTYKEVSDEVLRQLGFTPTDLD